MPEVNGTAYDTGTPQEVIDILERCRVLRTRIRWRYGDDDGQDWGDSMDQEGYIGRSCGRCKVPISLHNSRSIGGPALLTARILRIETTKGKRLLYQAHNYKPPMEVANA